MNGESIVIGLNIGFTLAGVMAIFIGIIILLNKQSLKKQGNRK